MVAPGLPWAAGPGLLWEADGPQWEVVPHLRAAAVLAAAPGVADLAAAPVGALAEVPGVEASAEAGVEALAAAPAEESSGAVPGAAGLAVAPVGAASADAGE